MACTSRATSPFFGGGGGLGIDASGMGASLGCMPPAAEA
eukprot:CAMPEP_0119470332 /NCGR_PEP_ID=MMETSP1344-20130328/3278_1 /TAXON_ID=236787 /ORGANISM="Florenciella parvula, Strain CCMP2471" /LENGTH=38 /DNA_ID= /DNA_START= /DNA_END= /DNA_ORIENTATION=